MVKAVRGVLLTCDAAVKQLLLAEDEKERFIIEDLDETHVLVSADAVQSIRERLEIELEKNTFTLETQ